MTDKFFKTAVSLALFISVFACSSISSAATPAPEELAFEQQAVYAFFVSDQKTALILQSTSTDTSDVSLNFIKESLEGVERSTLDNYVARNQAAPLFPPGLDLGTRYELLTPEQLSTIGSQPDWGRVLKEQYPNSDGYFYFSQVGFNDTLDQALVLVGRVHGPLSGTGDYYLLEKRNGEWIIVDAANWIIS